MARLKERAGAITGERATQQSRSRDRSSTSNDTMPIKTDDKKKLAFEVIEAMIAVNFKKLIGFGSRDVKVTVVREPHVIAVRPTAQELRIGTQATGGVVSRIGTGSDSARRARARLSNLGLGVAQLPENKRRAIAKSQESISEARRSAEMHEGQLRIN